MDQQRGGRRRKTVKMRAILSARRRIQHDRCRVKMRYLGRTIQLNEYSREKDEILVMQQHSGGENLRVFQGFLHPHDSFEFDSLRERDFPFALTFSINGFIHGRVSVCCEYKHQCGIPLGGRRASFLIEHVEYGRPCLMCRFQSHLRKKSADERCDEAKTIYEELFVQLSSRVDWRGQSYLHWQLGNVASEGLLDVPLALDHYLISLELLCSHLSSTDEQVKDFYRLIGEMLQQSNDDELSLEYFRRFVEIPRKTRSLFSCFSSFPSRTIYDAKLLRTSWTKEKQTRVQVTLH